MSKIDLERLIVRRTYFIPIKSSKLRKTIEDELNASAFPLVGILPWGIIEEHGLSFHFHYEMRWSFLFDATWTIEPYSKECEELAREKSKEFDEMGKDAYYVQLQAIRKDIPLHVHVRVINEEENGCKCKVECIPSLYEKLRYLPDIKTNDFEMQNAYLECKRFLETIFESGLSARLISEEKRLPPQITTQFLINDEASHKILNKIKTMLDEATGEVLICGWVGTLLLPKLKELRESKINIRIITHKSGELKGKQGKQDVDRAYRELIPSLGKENISISPECHFRVLVVDNKALVGSMDFNATSLTGTHREFAIYTEIPEIVRSIRNYFNQVFAPLEE